MQAKFAPSRVSATINSSSLAEKINKSSSTDDISNVKRKTKAASSITDPNERAGSISSRLRSSPGEKMTMKLKALIIFH